MLDAAVQNHAEEDYAVVGGAVHNHAQQDHVVPDDVVLVDAAWDCVARVHADQVVFGVG